jgi:hypothetical protein
MQHFAYLIQIDTFHFATPYERYHDRDFTRLHEGDMASPLTIYLPTKGMKQPSHIRLVRL